MPVAPGYLEFLYQLAISEENGFRWRYLGAVPTVESFQQNLWSGVLTQFVVVENESSHPIGLVVAYSADLHHGLGYVGGTMTPRVGGTGLSMEGFDIFLRYLFTAWNFRKLYFEVPEYNSRVLRNSVGAVFAEEGRLRHHIYYDGRYWDRIILAIYRDTWLGLPRGPLGRRRRRNGIAT